MPKIQIKRLKKYLRAHSDFTEEQAQGTHYYQSKDGAVLKLPAELWEQEGEVTPGLYDKIVEAGF